MGKRSRRHRSNLASVDRTQRYELADALQLLRQMSKAKFDESVDVAVRLGVDPKKSDQMVRGVAQMPHGTGRPVRVLVFAKGDKEQEAKDAGADYVGGEDLVEQIKGGWLEFDKAVATPDMMPKVGPIAKILGPRGLMPNPKVGTVTTDVARAVKEQKAGAIEFRVEKAGIVHAPIGRLSFEDQQLVDNFNALIEQIVRAKPQTSKGNYLLGAALSTTMGPGLKVDPTKTGAAAGG